MKIFSLGLITVLSTVHAAVTSSDEPSPPEPTVLESFVGRPTVVFDLVAEVGSLQSADASVAVSAVIARDTGRPGERMKGVRFVMENNLGIDLVYLDEAQLTLLMQDLAVIDGGIAGQKAEVDAPIRVEGTGACWMPARPVRILCPSYRVGPDWAGLHLAAYGGQVYIYPEQRPAALEALVKQAIALLRAR
jgi:hypothetical protein